MNSISTALLLSILFAANAVTSADDYGNDLCLVGEFGAPSPGGGNSVPGDPFIPGVVLRATALEGGSLAETYPFRVLNGVVLYYDGIDVLRQIPISGTAILTKDSDGLPAPLWIASVDGLGVQPPQAAWLPPQASHGTHHFRFRFEVPSQWLGERKGHIEDVGDPDYQVGRVWIWNHLARSDDLGGDDLSATWAGIWRIPCYEMFEAFFQVSD